jgi:hypothetical protein
LKCSELWKCVACCNVLTTGDPGSYAKRIFMRVECIVKFYVTWLILLSNSFAQETINVLVMVRLKGLCHTLRKFTLILLVLTVV